MPGSIFYAFPDAAEHCLPPTLDTCAMPGQIGRGDAQRIRGSILLGVSAMAQLQPDEDGYIKAAVADGPVTTYLLEKLADGTLHLVPVEPLPDHLAEIIERDREHPERRVRRQHPLASG